MAKPIFFRVSNEERTALEKEAEQKGITLSDLVKQKITSPQTTIVFKNIDEEIKRAKLATYLLKNKLLAIELARKRPKTFNEQAESLPRAREQVSERKTVTNFSPYCDGCNKQTRNLISYGIRNFCSECWEKIPTRN